MPSAIAGRLTAAGSGLTAPTSSATPTPSRMPMHAAAQRQRRGLDQELRQDVARRAPSALRMPISRVRSVTDTSMMFMITMPPTSSEIAATPIVTTKMPPVSVR